MPAFAVLALYIPLIYIGGKKMLSSLEKQNIILGNDIYIVYYISTCLVYEYQKL